MSRKKFNTMSFNNFKPFGEKIQTFTQKPITLIYGPNSIGKSSLLQSMLYFEYLKNISFEERSDSYVLNLKQSNFAGDELDLGGFENFVSMHDITKSIHYSHTINNNDDLKNFFPDNYIIIKAFEKEGVFDFIENLKCTDTSIDKIIRNRLYNYQIKENHYVLSSATKSYIKQNPAEKNHFKNLFISYNNLENNTNANTIFNNCLNSKTKYKDVIYRSDSKKLDPLDDYLLFVFDLILKNPIFNNKDEIKLFDRDLCNVFLNYIPFYRYIVNITNITFESKIQYSKELKKTILTNILKIDNEIAITINYRGSTWNQKQTVKVNGDCQFIEEVLNYLLFLQDNEVIKNHSYELGLGMINKSEGFFDFIEGRFVVKYIDTPLSFIKDLSKRFVFNNVSNIQYIGPLRYLPSRLEYYKMVLNKSKTNLKDEFNFHLEVGKIDNHYSDYVYKVNHKFLQKILEIHLIKLLFLLPKFIPILFKMMIHYMKSLMITFEAINIFRSKTNKTSLHNSKTSEKMWHNLIHSQELQEKVNHWLGNEKKLKTPYMIGPIEYRKKLSFFKKLFTNKKEILFEYVPQFIDVKKKTIVSIKDMGLGVSQVLPVIISTIATKDTKIFIEQPELHLHPAVQAELADEFIRSYKENNNEFMIETHSEHLLLRIMKRMRHTAEGRIDKDDVLALTPDDICLLYVDNDGENTFINELELDDDGTLLDPWPNGFFEEGHKERFD